MVSPPPSSSQIDAMLAWLLKGLETSGYISVPMMLEQAGRHIRSWQKS
jgi:hypothetical protein